MDICSADESGKWKLFQDAQAIIALLEAKV